MSLMLIDSASLWYRAYYGMPDSFFAEDLTPVNAVRGFVDSLSRLVGQYKPDRLVACIEGDWRPQWRVDLFPGYKANRLEESEEEEPETLTPQIPIILEVLDAFGITVVGADNYEADDVIASYAKSEKGPIRIVTGDRDLFQLIDEERDIKVIYLAKGIANHDLVDHAYVENRYQIPGDRYALFATLRGDPSDGLPGVRGIGEKGAAAIARSFENVEDVISAAHSGDARLTASHAKKILADLDYLAIAPTLVKCADDVPLPRISTSIPKAPSDLSQLYQLKDRFNLGATVDRLISALAW